MPRRLQIRQTVLNLFHPIDATRCKNPTVQRRKKLDNTPSTKKKKPVPVRPIPPTQTEAPEALRGLEIGRNRRRVNFASANYSTP